MIRLPVSVPIPGALFRGSGAAAAGLVLAVILAWGCSRREPAPETPPAEATMAELESTPEGLRRPGATNLYTGWLIARYPSGELQSRSAISNGLLAGISEGWHTNGQIQVREHFVRGVSHGVREKWHPDGTRQSEATIVEGRLHGTFRRWHENGRLSEEVEMRDNRPVGTARAWDPDGRLRTEVRIGSESAAIAGAASREAPHGRNP
ncbi:MAG: toxin-antitoxin system YwqK family antitoxin [Verrucomicrobiae bacterium]|nr:toxin-antitoxin system YwqK family antitoxin [Verrucomicrobiae bacterium]